MTYLHHGQKTNLSRVAGFTWVLEWEEWQVTGEYDRDNSEVTFVSLSPDSALGGTYFVSHIPETGNWFAYEMGGRGPLIWENSLVVDGEMNFPSPMIAMKAVRKAYNLMIESQMRAEEELGGFFEEERLRAALNEKEETEKRSM